MRRLEGPELIAYDLIDVHLARRVRVIRVPFIAPGSAGMTIGHWVLLRHDDDRSGHRELIAHELVHVRQFEELGLIRFLTRYFRDYLRCLRKLGSHRRAYLAIPAEVDARREAASWAARQE